MQENAELCRLTVKQERAIVALLTNPTIAEAAKAAQLSERVLYKWLQQAAFKGRLVEERSKLRDGAFATLKSNLTKAVERLGVLLDSGSETVVLKACQMIIDYNIKLVEQEEFEARLSKLEEAGDEEEGYD